MQRLALAKDLKEGDFMMREGHGGSGTVRGVVSSAQVIRKPVVIITLELQNGRITHLTYTPNSTVTVTVKGGT